MKRKDLALIGIIVFISAIISLFASKALFGSTAHDKQAEVVQPITADFTQPDSHYFNNSAFDPTRNIKIGQNSNPDPFSKSAQ